MCLCVFTFRMEGSSSVSKLLSVTSAGLAALEPDAAAVAEAADFFGFFVGVSCVALLTGNAEKKE